MSRQKFSLSLTLYFILSLALATSTSASADVLSEGWYKILLGQQHIGYVVQRFELDPKKNQVVMTSYLRTNTLGGDITESLKAHSTVGFEPISYQYSLLRGKEPLTIDAKFVKNKSKSTATILVTEKGETKTHTYDVPEGTFLSNYLGLVMTSFKNPKDASDSGIRVGRSFNYKAIAEEDGQLANGSADVLATDKFNGHDVFRVRGKFKGHQSISYVTPMAETAQTNQPTSGHQVIATTRNDATRGFPSAEKSIQTLFGKVPQNSALTRPVAPPPEAQKMEDKKVLGVEPDLSVPEGSRALVPPGKGTAPSDNP